MPASDSENLVALIARRLDQSLAIARQQFQSSSADVGVRHCWVDDLLPLAEAHRIHAAFPSAERMRLMSSFREVKYTTKSLDAFDPVLKAITFAMQSPEVIEGVSAITDLEQQVPDPSLYAGGLSMMGPDHFLNPHIDNSHDGERQLYRTLNLLYYVTPEWALSKGGSLELWDRAVRRNVTIESRFNRLVLMETTPWSWHSVNAVKVPNFRCCVSNYYFSPRSPTGAEYFHVTSFSARPEQKIRRAIAWTDGKLRRVARVIFPAGLGKKDVYRNARN
jgi:Rps23 Pro-64 3,4-dihydroxylase Tpa1-like proline 4-hydroxylase